jgi:LuxR family maltose regulon positive regulatory protein
LNAIASTLLIATKILPPKGARELLDRARLITRASDIEETLLTLVKAPGGFGKTTLARAWSEALAQRGNRIAWLSLDADDDEPQRFLNYVVHACHRAHPDVGAASLALFSESALAQPAHALSLLISEMAGCGEEIFFFLDDYQCITLPAIHDLVSFMLRYAPSNLHLVILSREDAPLATGSLRVRNKLLEIDAAQLRFTADEIRLFFSRSSVTALSDDDTRRIHTMTEGWAAALRIMSLSLQESRMRARPIPESLAGVSRSIDGFLGELLAQLPADLVDFMMHTSLPDRLSPELCVALAGGDTAREQLAQLVKRQLLTALDDEGQWFAYHQLIREHLRQGLQQRGIDGMRALHRRAAEWYWSHELWSHAVKHALEAGATAQAFEWIEQCAMRLVRTGDLLTLLSWERQLQAHVVRQPARLKLAIAWARALATSTDEASRLLGSIEAEADTEKLRSECKAVRSVLAALNDDHQAAYVLASEYLCRPIRDPWIEHTVYNVLRFAHLKAGRWADFYATPSLPRSGEDGLRNPLCLVYGLALRGAGDLARGALGSAEKYYLDAMRLSSGLSSAGQVLTALPAGLLSHVLYERNQVAEADALLADRLDVLGTLGYLDCVMRVFLVAARIAVRHGRIERAYALLEQAENIGISRRWHRLTAAMLLERLRLCLSEGRMTEAQAYWQRLRQLAATAPRTPANPLTEVSQFAALGEACLALAHDRYRDALPGLEELLEELLAVDNRYFAVRVGLTLATAHMGLGDNAQAARVFHSTLAIAAEGGMISSILDQGQDVGCLLAAAKESLVESNDTAALPAFAARVLHDWQAIYGKVPAKSSTVAADMRNALSQRECGILELIADGNSNKEIARLLGIGPETVKTHLKNIFIKLSVERRTQAVVRAEAYGLLKRTR